MSLIGEIISESTGDKHNDQMDDKQISDHMNYITNRSNLQINSNHLFNEKSTIESNIQLIDLNQHLNKQINNEMLVRLNESTLNESMIESNDKEKNNQSIEDMEIIRQLVSELTKSLCENEEEELLKIVDNLDKENQMNDKQTEVDKQKLDDSKIDDKEINLNHETNSKNTENQLDSDIEIIHETNPRHYDNQIKFKKTNEKSESRNDKKMIDNKEIKSNIELHHIIKLKRLPANITIRDLERFFRGYRYKEIFIHKIDNRFIGEAFMTFDSEVDLVKAFDRDCKRMHSRDKRSIEIFRADIEELRICLEDNDVDNLELSQFVKCKGIPFNSKKEEIEEFFKGLSISKNGIIIPLDHKYRTTRDCYVQFESVDDAKKALKLNNEPLGTRYVKVMKSSKTQFKNQANSMLTKNLILENYTPNFPKAHKKPSIHKVKLYNNSREDYSSTIDARTNPREKQNNGKISNDLDSISAIFPYYYESSENRSNRDQRSQSSRRRQPNNQQQRNSNRRSNNQKNRISSNRKSLPKREELIDNKSHRSSYDNLSIRTDKRSRSSSTRSKTPTKRIKPSTIPNGFYFKSSYNNDPSTENENLQNKLKTVMVQNLPNNMTKEELYDFFESNDLYPKQIKIFVDRGRRYTEGEVLFRTFEDAKRSFILSGARLTSKSGSRNVDIIINPELKNINIINPSKKDDKSIKKDDHLNRNHSTTATIDNPKTSTPLDLYESKNDNGHLYSNSELINQLKHSIHESLPGYFVNGAFSNADEFDSLSLYADSIYHQNDLVPYTRRKTT